MKRFNWIVSGLAALWAVVMFVIIFFLAMSVEEFVILVSNLRKVQRAYFKDRKHGDLVESKRLETLVDRALAAGIALTPATLPEERDDEQIGLFE